MPFKNKNFKIDFDFIDHVLRIVTDQNEVRTFSLHGISVSQFYLQLFQILENLGIKISIKPFPVELQNPIPFKEDNVHKTYDEEQVEAFHSALLKVQAVFLKFRSGFKGKSSPIHFFWGGFDLALSFFSGRRAPKHPGGVPGMPDWVAEEAYCREVSSAGFWTGNESLPEPAFYAYLYPEPEGYKTATVLPEGAYYHTTLGEFILPYSFVQQSESPGQQLLDFLQRTYSAGADLANWDRDLLEN